MKLLFDPATLEASAAEAEAFLRSLASRHRRERTTVYYRIASERVRPILEVLYRLFLCASWNIFVRKTPWRISPPFPPRSAAC